MEAKSLLRDSEHYSHIRIYPDKPKWQLLHESNMRMLVKTLGQNKLFIRGNRICDTAGGQHNFNQSMEGKVEINQGAAVAVVVKVVETQRSRSRKPQRPRSKWKKPVMAMRLLECQWLALNI